ncbi:prenylated Rab acceptor protein 1 [Petromyzon marinus]|uniref:PRA1 family protein n=2 Tax=Petromyzon marinus TaxID=7757 RepID=A0AAJ7TRA6_PETMA|nr:prenylated Rab acceptor protein 1 [Petromyzon marinus]
MADRAGETDPAEFGMKADGAGLVGRLGRVHAWVQQRRTLLRPWSSFVEQKRFTRPRDVSELCRRVVRNGEHFQANYMMVFLGLAVYCVMTSPMLLLALAVFLGACYIISLRSQTSKLVLMGRELSVTQQYGAAAGVSFPLFWLAGAGSAVFWVLGATLFVIGGHASLHELEQNDFEELQMESV